MLRRPRRSYANETARSRRRSGKKTKRKKERERKRADEYATPINFEIPSNSTLSIKELFLSRVSREELGLPIHVSARRLPYSAWFVYKSFSAKSSKKQSPRYLFLCFLSRSQLDSRWFTRGRNSFRVS